MDEGHGSGNSSQVLGGDLEYSLVYRARRRSVFEDSVEWYFNMGAGNAQHPILQRRVLFSGVHVAFECYRIDHPNIRGTGFQDGLDFAKHLQRMVFRRENLNPEERRR